MFSTIKSIFKTLSILSLFATLVVAGLSNVNASAKTCPGYTQNFAEDAACPAPSRSGGTSGNRPGGANGALLPDVCNGDCPVFKNAGTVGGNLADRGTIAGIILNFARFFIFIAAAIAVLFIVYGGYLYIADGGDEKRSATGKKVLINAIIGLAVCILSITIVQFIGGSLQSDIGSNLGTGK